MHLPTKAVEKCIIICKCYRRFDITHEDSPGGTGGFLIWIIMEKL